MGGAIVNPVSQNIEAPAIVKELHSVGVANSAEAIHRLLQKNAQHEFASQLQLRAVADNLLDYRPRNLIGYNQYIHHFHAFPEEKLLSGVEKEYSGHGASKDHPKLHQLFMDSFQHHPELVSLYTNS